MRMASKLFIGLFAIGIIMAIASDPPDEAPKSPKDPAQEARETAQYAVAAGTSKRIRAAMREPDSLEYISLRVSDDAKIVCAEYRARNGFGGMSVEHMTVTSKGSSQEAKSWNTLCTKPMRDMMWAAK